jgi:hypothetical protein
LKGIIIFKDKLTTTKLIMQIIATIDAYCKKFVVFAYINGRIIRIAIPSRRYLLKNKESGGSLKAS